MYNYIQNSVLVCLAHIIHRLHIRIAMCAHGFIDFVCFSRCGVCVCIVTEQKYLCVFDELTTTTVLKCYFSRHLKAAAAAASQPGTVKQAGRQANNTHTQQLRTCAQTLTKSGLTASPWWGGLKKTFIHTNKATQQNTTTAARHASAEDLYL